MKRMLSAMLVCLPLSMAPAMVAAESGPERLQRVVDELQSLQAEFEQTVLDSDFVVDEVSRGRPGRGRPPPARRGFLKVAAIENKSPPGSPVV
jgi:hypothetical protein